MTPHPRDIAGALDHGLRWTAKFIADREVEEREDYLVGNAKRALAKIARVKQEYRPQDWSAIIALALKNCAAMSSDEMAALPPAVRAVAMDLIANGSTKP